MFDKKIAKEALRLALPTIGVMLASEDLKRNNALHIAIGRRRADGTGEILVEHSIGEPTTWERTFDEFARKKVMLSIRTGLSTLEIQTQRPDLLQPGDILFYGSVVRGTIVVGVSAQQPYFDHAIANVIASIAEGLCMHRHATQVAAGSITAFWET